MPVFPPPHFSSPRATPCHRSKKARECAVALGARIWVRNACGRLRAFCQAEDGNVAVIFGLATIPILTGLGMAIDYSRAAVARTSLQGALDSAVIAGAKDGTSGWTTTATDIFKGNLQAKSIAFNDPSFSKTGTTYSGTANAPVPTSILGIVGINSIAVNVSSTVESAPEGDNSCILTLDKGAPKSDVSMKLNGAPNINLAGCSIRSNTSMTCNGHDGNATKSYAAGSTSGCANPVAGASIVPDIYSGLASNISKECGSLKTGFSWVPGVTPTGAQVKLVNRTGYTEYHICGNLTFSTSGSLFGASPSGDTVIVVENGSIIVDDKVSLTAMRATFVMTGDNNSSATIEFPNGNGKAASLTVSPSTNTSNPWSAVSVYLDPALTKNVDNTWGPGASFNADGLVYLANSNLTTNGNAGSSNSKCTKMVLNSLTTNGSLDLNFSQQNCTQLGLKQWDGGGSVRLVL
jgi:hypothetical protein